MSLPRFLAWGPGHGYEGRVPSTTVEWLFCASSSPCAWMGIACLGSRQQRETTNFANAQYLLCARH